MDGPSSDDYISVKNGQPFVREGDTHPDIAPFTITIFSSAAIDISNHGDVLWYARWTDPVTLVEKKVAIHSPST